jgi:DNA-binding protein YbaB
MDNIISQLINMKEQLIHSGQNTQEEQYKIEQQINVQEYYNNLISITVGGTQIPADIIIMSSLEAMKKFVSDLKNK